MCRLPIHSLEKRVSIARVVRKRKRKKGCCVCGKNVAVTRGGSKYCLKDDPGF